VPDEIVRTPEDTAFAANGETRSRGFYAEIFAVSFAGLLLEVSYTRIISFKFYYYWVYLVIGLALLGIGAGGVLVAVSKRLRRQPTEQLVLVQLLLGAGAVGVGYIVVAKIRVDTLKIWTYESDTFKNLALLLVVCLAIFISFLPIGVILSTLFGRKPERIGRLYFFDLVGAGIACAVVVSLISWIGPPATIFLGGVTLAIAAVGLAARRRSRLVALGLVLVGVLGVYVVKPGQLPAIAPDAGHINVAVTKPIYSAWSPIFRIDVVKANNTRLFYDDGVLGSVMYRWNGKQSTLKNFGFDRDPRALPFDVLGMRPGSTAIIGAAGGHEVLAALYFHASHIDAVELNPITVKLVTTTFADYDGHLAQNPRVHYILGDGRSFLARTSQKFNLIWYTAPDSYSATNAATASASVLSESYLYTTQAIIATLKHLRPNGIMAAQFGEIDFAKRPNRTTRYVSTVRQALTQMGVRDPASHIMVSTAPPTGVLAGLSTILVKATPFTPSQVDSFVRGIPAVRGSVLRYAPGRVVTPTPVSRVITLPPARLKKYYASYPFQVSPVSDNQPFFWHFARFSTVIANFFQPLGRQAYLFDQEDSIGERVLLLLLGIAVLLALVFLLLPFLAIRGIWVQLPRKGATAVYFAAIGFGFIFFEIALIQRLVLFLGYPSYSLTVTLASLLIFVGVGALLSGRWRQRIRRAPWLLFVAVAGLTAYYLFGLPPTTDALLQLPLAARVPIAFGLLAPLGVCLGMFMPLGLGTVASLSPHAREYVAWSWAVNGFASVAGSVLATIVAMTYGLNSVLFLALVAYAVALVSVRALLRRSEAS
jgi:hypothetical protein